MDPPKIGGRGSSVAGDNADGNVAATPTWRTVVVVGAFAAVTVVGADAALHAVAPPRPLVEVEDAVAAYEASDPTVLVIGSSHARTFLVVGRHLAELTGGRERLVAVPVEMGKMTSYDWVLRNRLVPLMDEVGPDGGRARPSLKRVILVTEWWDSAEPEDILTRSNIPARAWRLSDFLADAWANGLTPYNRNYVSYRWVRMARPSALVQDRGHDNILKGLAALVRGPDPAGEAADREKRLEGWRHAVERGATVQAAPDQMAAFEGIVDFFQGRGVEVTVLLYPRMPGTLTERSKATTIASFSERMRQLAARKGFRLVDESIDTPLTDDHFEADFDHITRDGNELLSSRWLGGDLAFLRGEGAR
jgi:hypothetical protein